MLNYDAQRQKLLEDMDIDEEDEDWLENPDTEDILPWRRNDSRR